MSFAKAPSPLDYLFKFANKHGIADPPVFEQLVEQGPPHMKVFIWRCFFMDMTAQGQGKSKKEAKNAAARVIKHRLEQMNMPEVDTYQARMEKKRKKEESREKEKAEEKAEEEGQAKKKYDYNAHIQRQKEMEAKREEYERKRREYEEQLYFQDEWCSNGPTDQVGLLGDPRFGGSFNNGRNIRPFGIPDPDYVGPVGGGPGGGLMGPGPRRPLIDGPFMDDGPMGPLIDVPFMDDSPMGPPGLMGPGPMGPRGGPFMDDESFMGRGGPMGPRGPFMDDEPFMGRGGPMGPRGPFMGNEPFLGGPGPMGPGGPFMEDGPLMGRGGPFNGRMGRPQFNNEMAIGGFNSLFGCPPNNNPLLGPSFDGPRLDQIRQNDMPRMTRPDLHVIRKHKAIFPRDEEVDTLMQFVQLIEKALKNVSKEHNKNEINKLLGVSRVGDVAKGLLLATDRSANLVLVSKTHPSVTLLTNVSESLSSELVKVHPDTKYQIQVEEKEAGLQVSMTSTSYFKKAFSFSDKNKVKKNEVKKDAKSEENKDEKSEKSEKSDKKEKENKDEKSEEQTKDQDKSDEQKENQDKSEEQEEKKSDGKPENESVEKSDEPTEKEENKGLKEGENKDSEAEKQNTNETKKELTYVVKVSLTSEVVRNKGIKDEKAKTSINKTIDTKAEKTDVKDSKAEEEKGDQKAGDESSEKESLAKPDGENVESEKSKESEDKMEESSEKDQETRELEQLTIDGLLPLSKCQLALAEMRRTTWFVANIPRCTSCIESIRIIKDISNRDPETWGNLTGWAIEVLCEAALSSFNKDIANPSKAIRRIFEVVATGLCLKSGPGIKDPCERGRVDLFQNVSDQNRENLTKSAQEFVRKITFNKIHEVLGMNPIPKKTHRH